MKLTIAFCFVFIFAFQNGQTNGNIVGCQCTQKTNVIIYYLTSELRNFSSWNSICNCNNVESTNDFPTNLSTANSVEFSNFVGAGNLMDSSTDGIPISIKDCLDDCSR